MALTTSTSILSYSIFLAPLVKSTLNTDTTRALTQLCSYFRAGKPTVPPAAILDTLLFTALAYLEPSKRIGYGIGAIGTFSVIPFSMAYIIPVTNDRLLELERVAKGDGEVDKGGGEEVGGRFREGELAEGWDVLGRRDGGAVDGDSVRGGGAGGLGMRSRRRRRWVNGQMERYTVLNLSNASAGTGMIKEAIRVG